MTPPPGWFRVDRDAADRAAEVGPSAWLIYTLLCRHTDEGRRCWPGLARLALMSGLKRRAIQNAITRLEAAAWLAVDRSNGKGNAYFLPPIGPVHQDALPPIGPVHQDARDRCIYVHGTGAPTCTLSRPKKKTKKKKEASFDPASIELPFKSEQFRQTWGDFCGHRATMLPKPCPVTELAARRLLGKCRTWGEAAALQALDKAIESGWKGIFAPDGNSSVGGNGHATPKRDPYIFKASEALT